MVTQREIDGEQVIRLRDRILVASKSQPGRWYEVRDCRCECVGFARYGRCRHERAASDACRPGATPMLGQCTRCQAPLRPGKTTSLCTSCNVSDLYGE